MSIIFKQNVKVFYSNNFSTYLSVTKNMINFKEQNLSIPTDITRWK